MGDGGFTRNVVALTRTIVDAQQCLRCGRFEFEACNGSGLAVTPCELGRPRVVASDPPRSPGRGHLHWARAGERLMYRANLSGSQSDLFADGARMVSGEAVDLTVASLQTYGPQHEHWAIAWSGGKDSTATLTLIVRLIEEGRISAPKRLSVFYADTRLELPPLQAAAIAIIAKLQERDWIDVEIVRAPLDKRFLVYMLGRGVPPPNNMTFRWLHAADQARSDGRRARGAPGGPRRVGPDDHRRPRRRECSPRQADRHELLEGRRRMRAGLVPADAARRAGDARPDRDARPAAPLAGSATSGTGYASTRRCQRSAAGRRR